MIRFQCEHCAHKISVQDKHAGKRVKCQKCGSVRAVPAKSTIVDFHCESCGQKISVPQVHAGKKCKCPKCKSIVVVPTRPEAPAKSISTVRFTCSTCNQEIEEPESSRGKLVECPHCSSYVPVPSEEIPAQKAEAPIQPGKEDGVFEKRLEAPQEPEAEIEAEETETATQRKLPWIIDIFLYPGSKAGLTTLAIIVVIPLLIRIALRWLGEFSQQFPPLFVLFAVIAIVGFLVRVLLYLYLYWYFCECIRDSAAGGLRAPETLAYTPGLGDMLWQWLRILGCLLIFFAPMLIYYQRAKQPDIVFWALLGYAVFFFPMALLAVVMFDSMRGLNPILLIGSIFNTFLPYCAMVLVFASAGFLIVQERPNTRGSTVLTFIVYCVGIYLAMVVAHLLGWFYHRYEQELNWEV